MFCFLFVRASRVWPFPDTLAKKSEGRRPRALPYVLLPVRPCFEGVAVARHAPGLMENQRVERENGACYGKPARACESPSAIGVLNAYSAVGPTYKGVGAVQA